ncbi:MAG: hypothetical protein VXZ40_00055 [Nanoarchaeota archaeon]|nr:hypothetical protein [Nanoarchaeota archaeon]
MSKKKDIVEKKSQNLPNTQEEESPSWYHYVIILLVVFGVIWGISFLINMFDSTQELDVVDVINEQTQTYSYTHVVGNVTYSIELVDTLANLEKLDYPIEPNFMDILNTASFKFVFNEYNGSDNGQVTLSATKLRRYLSTVHFVRFDSDDFQTIDNLSCVNSTSVQRVVLFEVNSSLETGVFEEENGCLRVVANRAIEMPYLMDLFIISILKDK